MENELTGTQQNQPGKKEMHKQLTDKLATALPELKSLLGEKKFGKRTEKAAKLLLKGLHKEDLATQQPEPLVKAKRVKKARVKKAAQDTAGTPAVKRTKKAATKKTAAKATKIKAAKAPKIKRVKAPKIKAAKAPKIKKAKATKKASAKKVKST